MSSSNPADAQAGRALAAAIRYANRSVRSRRELVAYVSRLDCSAHAAARAVSRCAALGLVDDPLGARLWAEQWARRGYAASVIRSKLLAKGFVSGAVDEAAQTLATPHDEVARARRLIRGRMPASTDSRQRFRLARLLASHGFDPDVIEQALGHESTEPVAS